MTDDGHLAQLLAPYGPTRPVHDLVVDINRLYHAVEATSYDTQHPEITAQLPAHWRTMVEHAASLLPPDPLTVVDFGCGTGFAAAQVLSLLGAHRVRELVCYDVSPEMLERCKRRLRTTATSVRFCVDEAEWSAERVPRIDLLLTNSLLHHLPDPIAMAKQMRARMASTSVWLAGHEPSARYYRNPECVALWQRFERARRMRRLLSPRAYWQVGLQKLGLGTDPASVAARQAYARGWFRHRPSSSAIGRIVDLHVAHGPQDVSAGRGLDVDRLAEALGGSWQLHWMHSYSFLGAATEVTAPRRWQDAAAELARRHPRDGANFCAVWRPG